MRKPTIGLVLASAVACTGTLVTVQVSAQQGTLTPAQREQRVQTEKELESAAFIDRRVMMPMRDGIRLATEIYRFKHATCTATTIWFRTQYNYNFVHFHT